MLDRLLQNRDSAFLERHKEKIEFIRKQILKPEGIIN
jgi:hypothetical protein